jgi:hypothetical protein
MTIPELYPDLARLLGEYFSLESRRDGAQFRDAVLVFVLTEPHSTLLQAKSDAVAILAVDSELAAFEAFVREMGLDFSTLGVGIGVEDWLADVIALIGSSV